MNKDVCMYDIKFTNMVNDEVIYLAITHKYRSFKSESYGWKKIKIAQRNGFRFNKILKLTIKIDSNLSIIYINIHYY